MRLGASAARPSVVDAVAHFSRPRHAGFATASTIRPSAVLASSLSPVCRQFARSYADAAPIVPKKPGRVRKTFKWMWRATYLSLLAAVGVVIYDGYVDRHPDDQFIPDPEKKTLVVLGNI
jgi:NADH:ubiquinone reductase (non-electrogenic)